MNADPRQILNAKAATLTAGIERINGAEAAMEEWVRNHENDRGKCPEWFPEFAHRTIAEARILFETELVRLDTLMIAMNAHRNNAAMRNAGNMRNGENVVMNAPSENDLRAVVYYVEGLTRVPARNGSRVFVSHAWSGNTSMIRLMLREPGLNSHEEEQWQFASALDTAFNVACRQGYVDILKLLLQDGRVNPALNNNDALLKACYNGHVGVVELLLRDERVVPDFRMFFEACSRNHVFVVNALLEDGRVDPGENENIAFATACEKGFVDVVELLLQDEGVDPCDNHCNALRLACTKKHASVVHLLLKDPRVLAAITPLLRDDLMARSSAEIRKLIESAVHIGGSRRTRRTRRIRHVRKSLKHSLIRKTIR